MQPMEKEWSFEGQQRKKGLNSIALRIGLLQESCFISVEKINIKVRC